MTKRRKTVAMTVVVTVPYHQTSAQARREVRTLINHQCNWMLDPGEVKVSSVRAAPLAKAKRKPPTSMTHECVEIDRSLLEAAIKEIRQWKVEKGGDDQVALNLEASLRNR